MGNLDFSQSGLVVKKVVQCHDVKAHPMCVHVRVCVSHIAVLLGEQQDLDALHVGASVQQVNGLVQVILTSQRNGQLPGSKKRDEQTKCNNEK